MSYLSSGKPIFFLFMIGFLLSCQLPLFGQTKPAPTREEIFAKQESKMIYPLIKSGPLSGVLPVEYVTNSPKPNKTVKLIFDFTQSTSSGHQADKVNEGFEEVARILNLHIASGTKKDKLKAIIVLHSGSILSVFNNEFYRQKFKTDNPNLNIIHQLTKAGVMFVVCGQSLALRDFSHELLLPEAGLAFSARSTLTKYAAQGYYTFQIKE